MKQNIYLLFTLNNIKVQGVFYIHYQSKSGNTWA